MSADCGRSEVYAAEVAAFDGTDLETERPFEVLAQAIESVVSGGWWPGPPVEARPARRDAASSSARSVEGGVAIIRLATRQTTIATAAHELAHALAGPAAGHSPVFLAAYLDVVAVITNLDSRDRRHHLHVDQLRASFDASRLVVGRRDWPAPPPTTGSAIAL
jgi:hypothetical protein